MNQPLPDDEVHRRETARLSGRMPLPDPHDTEELFELSTGWLVCPTCDGEGGILVGELATVMDCPDCDGTGEPPMQPIPNEGAV